MTVKVGRFCMKNHREDDYGLFLWISWTFRDGLFVECLMDCLEWISAELDWISAAICVCGQVAQAMECYCPFYYWGFTILAIVDCVILIWIIVIVIVYERCRRVPELDQVEIEAGRS